MKRTILATVLAITMLLGATPADAALATSVNNACDSATSLIVANPQGVQGLLARCQSTGGTTFQVAQYGTNGGMCTNMYDHNNGFRWIVSAQQFPAGRWSNIPYVGHTYTIKEYYPVNNSC